MQAVGDRSAKGAQEPGEHLFGVGGGGGAAQVRVEVAVGVRLGRPVCGFDGEGRLARPAGTGDDADGQGGTGGGSVPARADEVAQQLRERPGAGREVRGGRREEGRHGHRHRTAGTALAARFAFRFGDASGGRRRHLAGGVAARPEDRHVQSLQVRTGLDAELVGECLPALREHLEGLGMTAGPVQSLHEVSPGALAGRVGGDECAQLG